MCGKDASGLGFIGGVIGVVEPGSMTVLCAGRGADAEHDDARNGAADHEVSVSASYARRAREEGVAAAEWSSRAASIAARFVGSTSPSRGIAARIICATCDGARWA